jgi:hypothetical protein
MRNHGEVASNQWVGSRWLNTWNSKLLLIWGVLCAGTLLAGCEPVQSINPFYEDRDVIFDSSLTGTWNMKGDSESERMQLSFAESATISGTYDVVFAFQSDKPDADKPQAASVSFTGHLFQAGDSRFLDLYPVKFTAKWASQTISFDAIDNFFGVPTHTVYLVRQEGNELRLAFLDDDYVKAFVEKNDLPLTVRGSTNFVLSGKTEDLKAGLLVRAEREGLLDGEGIKLTRPE